MGQEDWPVVVAYYLVMDWFVRQAYQILGYMDVHFVCDCDESGVEETVKCSA